MSVPDYSKLLAQGCPTCGSAPGANCIGGKGQRLGLQNMHAARGRPVGFEFDQPRVRYQLRCPGRYKRTCASTKLVYLARRGRRRHLVGCCRCNYEWLTTSRLANGLPSPDELAQHDRKAEVARRRHQQMLEDMGAD